MKILKRNQIIISVIALMLITVGYLNYTSNLTSTVETGILMDAEQMAGIGDAKLVNSGNVVEENSFEENNGENWNSANATDNKNDGNGEGNKNGDAREKNADSENIGESVQTNNNSEQENLTSSVKDDSAYEDETSIQHVSANSYNGEYYVTSKLERNNMYSEMIETYQGLLESSNLSTEQKSLPAEEIAKINSEKNSVMIAENLIKNLGFDDVVIFVNDNSVSVVVRADSLQEADVAQIQNIVCREIGVSAEMIHISVR